MKAKESKTPTFYFVYHYFMRMVERREMKTERLNIKETLPDWKLIQLCYDRHVIPSKDLKTGSHVRCKCKRKLKWQCERVHTSNANAGKDRYASAVEVFFQDDRQWLSFCRFTRVGSEQKFKFKKLKCFCHLRWRLRLHLHLRWGFLDVQSLVFAFAFSFAEVLLVWLIDRGRCVY